jgi:CRISPR system Cascade subunit CasA
LMNLTTDPWIPIVWAKGQPGTVSLCEAFTRGEDIRDLAVRPHERIAVMRLLVCIAQAALDGPADHDDWRMCRLKIAPAALDYLKRRHQAFELLGDGPRFLQVEGLKKPTTKDDDEESNSVSKLDLALATGNTSTLFDTGGGSDREFTREQLALMLLTYQCFSPGGTIGVALWNDKPTPGWKSYPKPAPGQSKHAPCLPGSMLHAVVCGVTLSETVWLNLLSRDVIESALGSDKWGEPIWEAMPTSPDDKSRIDNATGTYLGRLVPLSRVIRLEGDCRSLLLANALTYPPYPEAREPSATVVVRKRNGVPTRATLGCSLDRAPWRELHSLTVKRIGWETNGGPLTLQNVSFNQPFDLWVGGL